MCMELNDLSAFQRDLLSVIASLDENEQYGLKIKGELEEEYDTPINHGRLYPNLDDLYERGLVEKGEIDRRTNSYRLTEKGEQALHDYLAWIEQRISAGSSTTGAAGS